MAWASCRWCWIAGGPLRTTDYLAECARRGVALVPRAAGRCATGWACRCGRGTSPSACSCSRSDQRAASLRPTSISSRNIADLAALALRSARLFEERTRAYGELAAAQDQLVRTEKLRALGEMASGVAHDFNNVLAAILGRAQLLLKEVARP